MRCLQLRWFALVLSAVMLLGLAGCGGGNSTPVEPIELPESIGQFKQTGVSLGKDALLDFSRQHQRKIPIKQGARGEYSDGTYRLELWGASGTSATHAQQMVSDMTNRIGKSHPVFNEPQLMDVPGGQVYKLFGQDQHNYYWVNGPYVYWVAIKAPNADEIMRSIYPELE